MVEIENTIKNLSIVLAGLSVEAGKIIKRTLILAGQLKKASLSLIIFRKEKVIRALRNEYTIYCLVIPRTKNHAI